MAISPNPGSLPQFVAEDLGYLAAEGVTVRRVPCQIGRECLQRLLAGEADLATTADLPLVMAAFAGQRFAIIATMNTNRNDTKIVTRHSAGVRGVADLAGRRIGTLLGTTAQYALESLLLLDGIDPARVVVVGLTADELRPALLARRVDAVAVFEPRAFELSQALGSDALVLGSTRIYTQTWNLVGPPAQAGSRPPAVAAVLRALDRAITWIATHPVEARATLRRHTGLGAEQVEDAWPSLGYRLELRQALLTTLEGQARWAQRGGFARGPVPNFLDFVDPLPLGALRPNSVPLAH